MLTASQWHELQAYSSIEPIGREYRSELRHGQQMAMTANINRDSQARPEPFTAVDFMNFVERPEEKQLTDEEIEAHFERIFGV